jgi:hypothetical protein
MFIMFHFNLSLDKLLLWVMANDFKIDGQYGLLI